MQHEPRINDGGGVIAFVRAGEGLVIEALLDETDRAAHGSQLAALRVHVFEREHDGTRVAEVDDEIHVDGLTGWTLPDDLKLRRLDEFAGIFRRRHLQGDDLRLTGQLADVTGGVGRGVRGIRLRFAGLARLEDAATAHGAHIAFHRDPQAGLAVLHGKAGANPRVVHLTPRLAACLAELLELRILLQRLGKQRHEGVMMAAVWKYVDRGHGIKGWRSS